VTNFFAAVSFSVDFQKGAEEQFRRKLSNCEANGVCCPGKSSVPNWSKPIFAVPRGEQLCLDAVIERKHNRTPVPTTSTWSSRAQECGLDTGRGSDLTAFHRGIDAALRLGFLEAVLRYHLGNKIIFG
jgi:hypothetical protein